MPPKAKTTKEMIIGTAMEVARESGHENINARTVAKKLSCSTQPIMYHFAKIEDMKQAAYAKADEYHTEYLMSISETQGDVMLEMINSEELTPAISAMQEAMNMSIEQTKEIFITLALFVHGYAGIIANNSLEFDEKLIITHLD